METMKVRKDDYESRSRHLHDLTDEQLQAKFWELTQKVVDPLIDLAKTHTTPSIERSVLLRMGFSSIEAKILVEKTIEHQWMGKGAGNVVYVLSKIEGMDIRSAGLKLMTNDGWNQIAKHFGGKGK